MQAQPAWESMLLDWANTALTSAVPQLHARHDNDALAQAYAYCEAMTRRHSKTFFAASGLLPREQRRAVRALYAFCRVTDDIVDWAGGGRCGAQQVLDNWRARTLDPHPSASDPVALAWADARTRFIIPGGYAEQLICGVTRDLCQRRYTTFDELAEYAYGVASTVGLMAMHIVGFRDGRALPYAVRLGVALQLTNILRDVNEDWARGRLYLPLNELAEYNLNESDIERMAHTGVVDGRWRRFMAFQIARARRLYDEAYPGIGYLDPGGRFAIGAAADLYRAILQQIERQDYNVFSGRAHTSTAEKVAQLPRIWWRVQRVRVTDHPIP